MGTFRDGLRSHQQVINRLNVYPVPDGDTGTNMALTLDSVAAELDELESTPTSMPLCKAVAHGSLMGARGNSGVILAQLLRGLADGLAPPEAPARARDLAEALVTADRLAREAVHAPGRGHHPHRGPGAGDGADAAADGGGRWWRWPRRPGPPRPTPWPGRPSCCRCWPRPAWSTPAAPATCCSSTPC